MGAERARRARFLLRRSDPEYLEVLVAAFVPVVVVDDDDDEVPGAPVAVVAAVPPRRSRRVRGLAAEFDEVPPIVGV